MSRLSHPAPPRSTARATYAPGMPARTERLDPDRTLLLVVDVQERFRPHIDGWGALVRRLDVLIRGCRALDLPIVATEQYPEGLGPTIPELSEALAGADVLAKRSFSALGDDQVVAVLEQYGRDQIIVAGIEAHVCVQQTVADLLADGRQAHVALDAISSRTPGDREIGVRRMRAAGMTPSGVELALFELLGTSVHPTFREISALVRDLPQAD
jgi:nicotinamidase-related amidase